MTDLPPPSRSQTVLQAGGQVATDIVGGLKAQPILLVIVLLNVIMVAGAAYFMKSVAGFVHEERLELISRCLPPPNKG